MYDDIPYGRDNPAEPQANGRAKIRVLGIGGAGNNAVNHMIEAGITSADYVAVNTDAQALAQSKAPIKLQIGARLTKGLGAGANPEIGKNAAEESKEEILRVLKGVDLLFITAGMGGGTGTGAAPVIAKMAREQGILTVAVVTEPFFYEARQRMENATKGVANLKKSVDAIIVVPNEKIAKVAPKGTSIREAFRYADDVLRQGIRGIADLIVTPALINLDFADVRTILKDKGVAHMGVGVAKGDNRIIDAVRLAVSSPLLDTTIEGATGIIFNVVGGEDLTFEEVSLAGSLIHSVVDSSANIIFGTGVDPSIKEEVEVTVIATGFPNNESMSQAGARGVTSIPRSTIPGYSQPRSQTTYAQPRPIAESAVQTYAPEHNPQEPAPTTEYAVPQQEASTPPRQQEPQREVAPQQPEAKEPPQEEKEDYLPTPQDKQKLPPFVLRLLGRKK